MGQEQHPKRLTFRGSRELDEPVFRAVERCPPIVEDFYSYADIEGRTVPTVDYLRASTVSMYLTREGLEAARVEYELPPHTAVVDLRKDKLIRWALTDEETGHIEVKGPSEVLLSCVVSYE